MYLLEPVGHELHSKHPAACHIFSYFILLRARTRFQTDILRKIDELQKRHPKELTVNYSELALELARDMSKNPHTSGKDQDTSSWAVPQAARPEYKSLFHSVKKSKMFKVALNKSLTLLERRGLIRIHQADKDMRRCPGEKQVAITSKGKKAILRKSPTAHA